MKFSNFKQNIMRITVM